MDNDNLCLKKTRQEIESMIDLAITDIFNSKKLTGKVADPSITSSLVEIIKTKWMKFDDLHKQQLTKQLKLLAESKTEYCKLTTNREILYYFTHYILPYSKESISSNVCKEKSLISACSWACDVVSKLKEINNLQSSINEGKRKERFVHACYQDYESALNSFYSLYGNPTKRDLFILKLRLMFTDELQLFKHLLQEKQDWQSIMLNQNKRSEKGLKA